jgi:hypothetical protein
MDEITLTGATPETTETTTAPSIDDRLKAIDDKFQTELERRDKEIEELRRDKGSLINQVSTLRKMQADGSQQTTGYQPTYQPAYVPSNDGIIDKVERVEQDLQAQRFVTTASNSGLMLDYSDDVIRTFIAKAAKTAENTLTGKGKDPAARANEGVFFREVINELKADKAFNAVIQANAPPKPAEPTEVTTAGGSIAAPGSADERTLRAQEKLAKVREAVGYTNNKRVTGDF